MFVALDSNAWFRERLLRSALGAALLFAIRRTGSRLVLPRVVRDEVVARLTDEGVNAVEDTRSRLLTLSALLGRRPDPTLPDAPTIRKALELRLTDLQEFVEKLEPSLEDYERALGRVIERKAPNERREQFRDSLILEMLLRHCSDEPGFFVTSDADFFAAKGSREVAATLKDELARTGTQFKVVATIEDVLVGLGQEALQPDRTTILAAITRDVLFKFHEHSTRHGYEISDSTEAAIEAFLTEDHNSLFVSFEVSCKALRIPLADGSVLPEGTSTAKGTATFNLRDGQATDVQIGTLRVRHLGGEVIHQDVTLYAEAGVFGARTAPYRLRRPLADFT